VVSALFVHLPKRKPYSRVKFLRSFQESWAKASRFHATKLPMAEGSPTPSYPRILREAGVEGNVLVSFVVNESGEADATSLKVIRSPALLARRWQRPPTMRFVPAKVGGRKRQLVQQPFVQPPDRAQVRQRPSAVGKAPFVVLRNPNAAKSQRRPPELAEVARYAASG
jgi:hypothetical protein